MAETPPTTEAASGGAAPARARVPLDLLPPFARFAFGLVALFQRRPLRWVREGWQRFFLEPVLWLLFFSRRIRVHGQERLAAVQPGQSLLVLANHRSFFDLFIIVWALFVRAGHRRRMVFPVRANFFYEHPLGLLINLLLTGASMFPPFFRSQQRRAFNGWALTLLQHRLQRPGNLVGFHPEGTRSKGDDPYALLPAQPGAGELALRGRPAVAVIPVFIGGLSNRVGRELIDNLRGRRPIWVVFGAPVDLSEWPAQTRLSHHKKCADALLLEIGKLGAEEKQLRAAEEARR